MERIEKKGLRQATWTVILSTLTLFALVAFQACGKPPVATQIQSMSSGAPDPTATPSGVPNPTPRPTSTPIVTPFPTIAPTPTTSGTPQPTANPTGTPTHTPPPTPTPATTATPAPSATPPPPPQPLVDINSFNSCPTGQLFTYPFILQKDWQEASRTPSSFSLDGSDTVRLYWDPVHGGAGNKNLLPNEYAFSGGFYVAHTKFGGTLTGNQQSHTFEIFKFDQTSLQITHEIEKGFSAAAPWFRQFRNRGTPQNQSNSEFLRKCVNTNVVTPYPSTGGVAQVDQQRFELNKSTMVWNFQTIHETVRENSVYATKPKMTLAQLEAARNNPTSFYSQDLEGVYPIESGYGLLQLNPQPTHILMRAAWWHGAGDIFERYFYAKDGGLFSWQWLERVVPIRFTWPNHVRVNALTYTQSGNSYTFQYHCGLLENPATGAGGAVVNLEIQPADQLFWKNRIDQARTLSDSQASSALAPSTGLTEGTVDGTRTYVHRTRNLGYQAPDSNTYQFYVACRHSAGANPVYNVKFAPNLLADPRTPPTDPNKLIMDLTRQMAP